MGKVLFDYTKDIGPRDESHLKCNDCGHEAEINPSLSYEKQADCPQCRGGQMMSWDWMGWKDTPERQERSRKFDEEKRKAKGSPVSQDSEPFENFTEGERTIHNLLVLERPGTEAPWLTAHGAGFVKIYGIRRRDGVVEFGIGNETPPILGWVTADRFYDEWPQ
jgi:hypothetical protein